MNSIIIPNTNRPLHRPLPALFAMIALICVAPISEATQVGDVVRIKGAEQSKLVGMGLVTGLDGTGDGGDFRPAMRPLAELIGRLMDPNVIEEELEDADNVALVALSANIPAEGVREGDRVDVHLSSVGPATSLRGGRLFLIPMTGPLPDSPVYAFAEGAVTIENDEVPTVGVVSRGAQLTRDVMSREFSEEGRLTLVLNQANASWTAANNLAELINGLLEPDGPPLARAIDQKNVVIQVPEYQRDNPAPFISQIMQTYIDPSQIRSGARVVINERTGTIVISGNVRVSPAVISHRGLTITTVPDAENLDMPPDMEEGRFLSLDPHRNGGAELRDLVDAFNQLQVPAEDRIEILKLLHESGKLHGQLILE